MPLTVHQIPLDLDESEEVLPARIAARLKVQAGDIRAYAVTRRSLDARTHRTVQVMVSVEVALQGGERHERRLLGRQHRRDVQWLAPPAPLQFDCGVQRLDNPPVVVGFGPAGMFAALLLARHGYRPIVIERGREVRVRHRDILQRFYREGRFDPESNLLFGEGGAGTYSDGKLYTRVNHPFVQEVLHILFEHGASADILTAAKPHIGSDRLPNVCIRIRQHIEQLGGEVHFGERLDALDIDEVGRVRGIRTTAGRRTTGHVLLAVGHSARDTIAELAGQRVRLVAKPFQLGVRIEHPQAMVDGWRYRGLACRRGLPPADYQLVAKGVAADGGDMFSFCMCPGGQILPTNEAPGLISTNGASQAARGGDLANSGLVVTIQPVVFGCDPLHGIGYQRHWERLAFEATGCSYAVPAQRASDLLAHRPSGGRLETSYPLGGCWTSMFAVLPRRVVDALIRALEFLDARWPGYAGPQAIITAPETRASAPFRIERDPDLRTSVSTPGLYPIGEGAGYAGGIVSAAIDGMKTAAALIARWAPFG